VGERVLLLCGWAGGESITIYKPIPFLVMKKILRQTNDIFITKGSLAVLMIALFGSEENKLEITKHFSLRFFMVLFL
jgi:hypothetical protein